jgi:hypothetical protein
VEVGVGPVLFVTSLTLTQAAGGPQAAKPRLLQLVPASYSPPVHCLYEPRCCPAII